jgi:hypothetical protein
MCLRFVPRSITVYLVLALSLTTHAQPKFVPLAIDSKPGSPPPQPCVDAHAIIRPLVSKYPHPDTWTWIIACDERSWSALVKHLGWSTAPWGYTMALTDQTAHITYVRADAVLHPKLGPTLNRSTSSPMSWHISTCTRRTKTQRGQAGLALAEGDSCTTHHGASLGRQMNTAPDRNRGFSQKRYGHVVSGLIT